MRTQSRARNAAIFGIFIFITAQFPISAIAQSGTAAEVADIAAAGAVVGKKIKGEALITDSLWGNLILDMAYQRDLQIKKIVKRLNIVNLGTMGIITAVAGGTLAQGIIALSVINPPPPQHDSYLPLGIGTGLSGLTLVAFAGRAAINHQLMKHLHNRQLVIKHQVEGILAKFESSHGDDAEAQTQLVALVGQRAANEWSQLWRSANVLAAAKEPSISLLPGQNLLRANTADTPLQKIYDHALTAGAIAEAK